MTFQDFNLNKHLYSSIEEMGFEKPTPIQVEAYPVVRSGKNVVGIAQTGTGKTLAYMLPILQDMKYSEDIDPKVLVIVPTRELVMQVVENIERYSQYMSVRVRGVYGGVNLNRQIVEMQGGQDILVATPRRLYDIVMANGIQLKTVKKLVIDEVDVMLDLGFRFQLNSLFELLPKRRQNIMFSATMTAEIDALIKDYFIAPAQITIAVSGTPLDNISQQCYKVVNFYTKANLLAHLLKDKETFSKVLVFAASKKDVDRLHETLEEEYDTEICVVHSNKSQNYRIRSIEAFNTGESRILITSDVMARGLDLEKITHVINVNTPTFPENYMHRIGRTGRAEEEGNAILFYTEKEEKAKEAIEQLMSYEIPVMDFPEGVEVSNQYTPEELGRTGDRKNPNRNFKELKTGGSFHEKKAKNMKTNQRRTYGKKKGGGRKKRR